MLAKKLFGHDHEIQYDTIINHDVYDHLRICLEVPREDQTRAIVVLNGREIGCVEVVKDGKRTLGYIAHRFVLPDSREGIVRVGDRFDALGKAVASVISDFVI